MFDIGWIEMAVIALIALVILGPNELPKAMRSLAKWTRKARGMAREFQSGIDDMVREADMEETRKAIQSAKTLDIGKKMEETIDPTGGLRAEAKGFQDEMAREPETAEGDAGEPDEAESSPEETAEGSAEESAKDVAKNAAVGAAAGAIGIGHPDDVLPPEPKPASEPEPVTVDADGGDAKQRA